MRNALISWRAAVASLMTITPSRSRVARAGRSLGILMGMWRGLRLLAVDGARNQRNEIILAPDGGDILHFHRIAEILRDRPIKGDTVMEKLLEAPGGEAIGIDVVIILDAVHGFVFGPFLVEKGGLVIHRLRLFAEPLDQHATMFGRALDEEQKRAVGKVLQDWVARIVGIGDFAQAPA